MDDLSREAVSSELPIVYCDSCAFRVLGFVMNESHGLLVTSNSPFSQGYILGARNAVIHKYNSADDFHAVS